MPQDVVRIRAQLIVLVEQLLHRYGDGSTRGRTELGGFTDPDSRALAGLVDALERLEAGTYGTCASCGLDIGRARLAELPSHAFCAACEGDELGRPFGVH